MTAREGDPFRCDNCGRFDFLAEELLHAQLHRYGKTYCRYCLKRNNYRIKKRVTKWTVKMLVQMANHRFKQQQNKRSLKFEYKKGGNYSLLCKDLQKPENTEYIFKDTDNRTAFREADKVYHNVIESEPKELKQYTTSQLKQKPPMEV
jgi:hypothetical protein